MRAPRRLPVPRESPRERRGGGLQERGRKLLRLLCLLRGRERRELAREGAEALANATLEWVRGLQSSRSYDPESERCVVVAEVVEKVYPWN
jgi:hypothetical protein